MYEVAVANMGNGEYMLIEPNRTHTGLARVLARWQCRCTSPATKRRGAEKGAYGQRREG